MDFLADSPQFLVYLGVLIGPFVQEDTAVVAAATLSVTKVADTGLLFTLICVGLFFSDIWKYWIGWAALKNEKGQAFAETKHIANLQDKVLKHTFITLITARFIPFTRIPIYVACGFFGVSYVKFCFYIAITALLYVGVIFAAFHTLGMVLGEKVLWVIPVIAVAMISVFLSIMFIKKQREKSTAN